MNTQRRLGFDREIALGREFIAAGDLGRAFRHLERAHVIGQTAVGAHAKAHWLMLVLEIRRSRVAATFDQAVRLVLGVIGSTNLQEIIDGTSVTHVPRDTAPH